MKSTVSEKPAVLGGKPTFKSVVPIVKPPLKAIIDKTLLDFRKILESRMITNSEFVRRLEEAAATYLGVKQCVATSSCSSALMLSIKALRIRHGEALLPSFTFPATAHAVYWNQLKIRLVDCDRQTFNMSIEDLEEKVTKESKMIMPVHVFGNPCNTKAIEEIAEDNGLKIIYDAAHAFGAKKDGVSVGGFGDAEVFSGSPTKAFTTVEGGIVATDNPEIAQTVKIGRNYGHYGDYNCVMPGLSARMSELHAALGLNLLPHVASDVEKRNSLARRYLKGLRKLHGIQFQKITANSLSTYKDFAIVIDRKKFGLNRDQLAASLQKENVMTRKYFYPPIHMQKCYPELNADDEALPNTSYVAKNVLCLPMFSELSDEQVNRIVEAVSKIQQDAKAIQRVLQRQKIVM